MQSKLLRQCKIAFTAQISPNKFYTFKIHEEIKTYPRASNSVIISSAAYITNRFPNLPLPIVGKQTEKENKKLKQTVKKCLSDHPLFDDWVKILASTFFQGNALSDNQTLYLKVNVSAEYSQYLKQLPLQFIETDSQEKVSKIFGINAQYSNKKIAWIGFSTSLMDQKTFEPFAHPFALFFGQIYNNEQIQHLDVIHEGIPSVEKLLKFHTIILPGSDFSVNEEDHIIEQTGRNLIEAFHKSMTLKLLGICFGHQLISKYLGVKVVTRKSCRGIHQVKIEKQLIKKFDFLSPLQSSNNQSFYFSQHHSDFVTEIPERLLRLGKSQIGEIQGLVSEDQRILTFQFHPEVFYPSSQSCSTSQGGQIENKTANTYDENKINENIKSSELIRQCMMKFI